MFPYGTKVRSIRASKTPLHSLEGTVVGYGTIMWPADEHETLIDDDHPTPVYLVQIGIGSSIHGPACIVMRADMVEEVK